MSTVLVSTLPPAATDDLRRLLAAAGFGVADHPLGAVPAVDFGPVAAAVVEVGERADVAAAQTRRWRIELGDEVVRQRPLDLGALHPAVDAGRLED
ncbi:MAG TPA: hypothetical protein VM533_10935, partial [Fimbriiglobus sp.]|nr:hypothetical protein [Fimbriiglobus sp.]